MYTPRGELNREFLELLYQGDVLKKLESCKNRQEVCRTLKQYLKKVNPEEIIESLVIIQTYLDEEQMEYVFTEEELDFVAGGMQKNLVTGVERIVGLSDHNPDAGKSIRAIYKNMHT